MPKNPIKNPNKYAPESPKKIFPRGKFKAKKPIGRMAIDKLKYWIKGSWKKELAINNESDATIKVRLAIPFEASIMLKAFVIETKAITVNKKENAS